MQRRTFVAGLAAGVVTLGIAPSVAQPALAFDGASGWAAQTPGGRGGKILRVTNLAASGPGSLRAAVETPGPRIIVFEVGGVIDLGRSTLVIREPFCTIAGQTAPEPGITIIRGGIVVEGHDVIVRHLRVRPGSAGAAKRSGWECDSLNVFTAHDVIIDHCSFSWGTDENLSVSGPRFLGSGPQQWRANTSHRVTLSNNIIAEGLANSTHSHGEHSKGSLINHEVRDVLVVGNLYASNRQRNPLFGGGASGAVINNLIQNPASQVVMLSSLPQDVGRNQVETGVVWIQGNVVDPGPATVRGIGLIREEGTGQWQVYSRDNLLFSGAQPAERNLANVKLLTAPPFRIPYLIPRPAREVRDVVIANVGARPWARDVIDRRIIADVVARRGRIIDDQNDVGGYPNEKPTHRSFEGQL